MSKLTADLTKMLQEASQKEYEQALIDATKKKKVTGKAPKMVDPVHLPGIGVMERHQAEKHFPGMNYREIQKEETTKKAAILSEGSLEEHNKLTDKTVKIGNQMFKLPFVHDGFHVHDANRKQFAEFPHQDMAKDHAKHLNDHFASMKKINEGTEGIDSVSLNIPLFIRMLEWAREDAKDDMDLHRATENLTALNRTATMDDYNSIIDNTHRKGEK